MAALALQVGPLLVQEAHIERAATDPLAVEDVHVHRWMALYLPATRHCRIIGAYSIRNNSICV